MVTTCRITSEAGWYGRDAQRFASRSGSGMVTTRCDSLPEREQQDHDRSDLLPEREWQGGDAERFSRSESRTFTVHRKVRFLRKASASTPEAAVISFG